jgi:hypothetical protein
VSEEVRTLDIYLGKVAYSLYSCGLAANQSVYDQYNPWKYNPKISKSYPTKNSIRRRDIRALKKARMAGSASNTIPLK